MVSVGLYNLLTTCTTPLHIEVQTFIVKAKIETESKIRNAITQIYLIIIINLTIMVNIIILHITRFYIRLQNTISCCNPIINLLLILENTCSFKAPIITDGMTILCTIEFRRVVIQFACTAMNSTIHSRNITYLITIICTIETNIIIEVLTNIITPAQVEFKTFILHITTIDKWCTSTSCCKNRSLYQPVLCSLDIIIKINIQTREETCINTDIKLLRCLPCKIFISQTTWESTIVIAQNSRRLCIVISRCTKQVMRISSLDRSQVLIIINILVTNLSPACTNFQIIHPLGSTLHPLFIGYCPTCRYRREPTIAMTTCKTARAVTTKSCVDHISFLPVPTQTTKIRYRTSLVMRITRSTQTISCRRRCTIRNISMTPISKAILQITATSTQISTFIATSLSTEQSTEFMFT